MARHFLIGSIVLLGLYLACFHHRSAGSLLNTRRQEIASHGSQAVMVGNSLLRAGVLPQEFEKLTGWRTSLCYSNGSASAWWYLFVKNVVCQVTPPPKVALIFFRDHFLTDPHFRTQGKYLCPLRTLCESDEPLLRACLGSNQLWNSSLTWAPQEVQHKLRNKLGKLAGKAVGLNKHEQRAVLAQAFAEERMVPQWITARQLQAESIESPHLLNFDYQLPHSFLPAMLAAMKSKGIQPVFVRMKRRRDLEQPEPQAVTTYIVNLSDYLSREKAILIDFSREPSIKERHFGPGDHLNAEGRALLTPLLAERLRSAKIALKAPSLADSG